MVQRGNGVRLAFEALGELFRGNLDGDSAVEARIARLVHLAHATGADGR
jgi:hypothetical protein